MKRPGVQVRAREGYLARRLDNPPASSPSALRALPRRTRTAALLTAALGRADAGAAGHAAGGLCRGRRGGRRHGALDPRHRRARPASRGDARMGRGRGSAGLRAQREGRDRHLGEGRAGQRGADGGDRGARRRGHGRRREGAGAAVRHRGAGALHGHDQRRAGRDAGRLGRAASEPPRPVDRHRVGADGGIRASGARSGCGSASASARRPAPSQARCWTVRAGR